MVVTYLSIYLVFVMMASIVVSLLVSKLQLSSLKILLPAIMLIIILPAVAGYFYVVYFASLSETAVPDVCGIQLLEAQEKLEFLKLKGRHAGNVYDEMHPEGQVVSQRPEAGRKVKIGRRINLLTSSGKRKVIVPNLLGRPLGQAEALLAAKSLFIGEVEKEFVSELDPGIILTQSPLPGEEVETGAFLDITVSESEKSEEKSKEDEQGAGEGEEEGGFKLW